MVQSDKKKRHHRIENDPAATFKLNKVFYSELWYSGMWRVPCLVCSVVSFFHCPIPMTQSSNINSHPTGLYSTSFHLSLLSTLTFSLFFIFSFFVFVIILTLVRVVAVASAPVRAARSQCPCVRTFSVGDVGDSHTQSSVRGTKHPLH